MRLTYANVVGTLALFVALGTGGAYAANTIFSEDIVNGEVKTEDLANGAVSSDKLKDDAVRGSKVLNDSLKGADVDESTLAGIGVRAYGRILSNGAITFDKGVNGNATNPQAGVYCLKIPTANPTRHPMIVGSDRSNNSTLQSVERVSVAEWLSAAGDCPDGQYEVVTYVYHGDATDDTDEATDQPGDDLELANQGFTFVVP